MVMGDKGRLLAKLGVTAARDNRWMAAYSRGNCDL